MTNEFQHLWAIDPQTTYLNHGSFGPSPVQVQQVRAEWSRKLEGQPMRFFCRQMEEELDLAAAALANLLGTKSSRIALIDNATFAMNVVASSTSLSEQDEVILTDHEYGAVRNIWRRKCRESGARLVIAKLPCPLTDSGVVAAIEACVSARTRMIVMSHVTSATAAILPVRQVCTMASELGVKTVIDGPHAIGMLDVEVDRLHCDFYCASCHKWLCAPFGSGFLWVHPRHQAQIQSPIEGWGGSMAGNPARWQDGLNWMGTRDPAAMLSIPSAIDFMKAVTWKAFRDHARQLVVRARQQLLEVDGVGPLCTPDDAHLVSMACVELPQPGGWKPGYHGHPDPLQVSLRDDHQIEIPVGSWNGHRFLRVSAHLYNTDDDIEKLIDVVRSSALRS